MTTLKAFGLALSLIALTLILSAPGGSPIRAIF